MGEMSHKQQNLVLTSSLQFRKNYQSSLRRVAVRFSDTLLKQFFPIVQLVNCEISTIWMAVSRRQANAYTVYFSCIMHLHKYLCLTCFNQHVLKRKIHYEMNSPGRFEAVQSTHSTWAIKNSSTNVINHCCSCFNHYIKTNYSHKQGVLVFLFPGIASFL